MEAVLRGISEQHQASLRTMSPTIMDTVMRGITAQNKAVLRGISEQHQASLRTMSPTIMDTVMRGITAQNKAGAAFTNQAVAAVARHTAESALKRVGVEVPDGVPEPGPVAFDDDSAWYAVEAACPDFTKPIDDQLTAAGLTDAERRWIRRYVLFTIWWIATAVKVTTGTMIAGPAGGVVAALLVHFDTQAATDKVMGWAGFDDEPYGEIRSSDDV
ncbi:hypothetical protein [Ornithinimicrobium pratense]|uniref:Uncharacterized protein n=1 Tax=Ornithinimicrobium pratense TaxID=2593973 RepID=A0A5J6V7C8_9MICO|nr:hypothetical protein [Ornithinimicrobium pratense]QFG69056.1 hypothetical protein FY030_10385 [Ornithinimicrobium pratense]